MQDKQKEELEELLLKEMRKLSEITKGYVEKDTSIRQMEGGLLKQVLLMCLNLLQFVIRIKLQGIVGKEPKREEGEQIKNAGMRVRKYLSIFGMIEFTRPSYHSDKRGMLYSLDEALDMPKELWSYNIQEMIGSSAVQVNYRESVKILNTILGLKLSETGSERNIQDMGREVEVYYEQKEVEKPEAVVCFSASFDGKGVPKIKDKKQGEKEVREIKRLGKGEKTGVKQMATVGVMSYFEPKERKVEDIIQGLMGCGNEKAEKQKEQTKKADNDNRWHQGIHRRAFLADQNKCIDYGINYIKTMMKHPESRFVVPIDAGIGLEDKVLQSVQKHGLEEQFAGIILDIIHVSEYVWDCANALLGEDSKLRTDWVKSMLEDLLNTKTTKVIQDLEKIVEKGKLSSTAKATFGKTITYFTNHQHKMDYKTFIEKGYPVSSALVESNCKHLVKDRMEQSGMRWSSKGAQNMMDMRAVVLNGDLKDFMSFIERKNRKIPLSIAA